MAGLFGLWPAALAQTGPATAESKPARRVVTLAPSLTDMMVMLGAGDRIVGTIDYGRPEQLRETLGRDVVSVGNVNGLNYERLVQLRPDLVLAWQSGTSPASISKMRSLGVVVESVGARRLDEIAQSYVSLARRLSLDQPGALAPVRRFSDELAELKRSYYARPPVRVFYQIWHDPLMTLSARHLISDVITTCGGENVFANAPALVPQVSREAVMAAQPQVIVATHASGADVKAARTQTVNNLAAQWQTLSPIPAVRNKQFVALDADSLERGTLPILKPLRRLCEALERVRSQR